MIGVIRYFGGIKLGTGGLTRAYGAAAKQAIAEANIVKWVEMAQMTLEIDYAQLQLLEYQLKQLRGEIIEQNFTDKVVVTLVLPAIHQQAIRQQFIASY